jgi:hypothetical protein
LLRGERRRAGYGGDEENAGKAHNNGLVGVALGIAAGRLRREGVFVTAR